MSIIGSKLDALPPDNPTGEWTAETLWEFIGGKIDDETTGLSKESAVQCYQAINAALTAERERADHNADVAARIDSLSYLISSSLAMIVAPSIEVIQNLRRDLNHLAMVTKEMQNERDEKNQ